MEKKKANTDKMIAATAATDNAVKDGYPSYPAKEDIYNKSREEENIDEEDPSKLKQSNEGDHSTAGNEKDMDEDESGDDLDVPGAELDDEQEETGNEDEENNYYSLGGDDHNNLDEGID